MPGPVRRKPSKVSLLEGAQIDAFRLIRLLAEKHVSPCDNGSAFGEAVDKEMVKMVGDIAKPDGDYNIAQAGGMRRFLKSERFRKELPGDENLKIALDLLDISLSYEKLNRNDGLLGIYFDPWVGRNVVAAASDSLRVGHGRANLEKAHDDQ